MPGSLAEERSAQSVESRLFASILDAGRSSSMLLLSYVFVLEFENCFFYINTLESRTHSNYTGTGTGVGFEEENTALQTKEKHTLGRLSNVEREIESYFEEEQRQIQKESPIVIKKMSPRRKPKGEILTPIPEEDSNLSTTSEAENKSNKKEKINENIRRRRLGRALMATEVHCKTRMAMIVWRVCKAYTSSSASKSDHTRTSDLSSILRTYPTSPLYIFSNNTYIHNNNNRYDLVILHTLHLDLSDLTSIL